MKKQNEAKLKKNKEEFDNNKIKEFKSYVEGKFREYTDKYIIIDFVNIHFHYNLDQKTFDDEFNGDLVFNFDYSAPYRQCHINIHKTAFDMWSRGQTNELEGGMLHELSHLHTHKLAEIAKTRFVSDKEFNNANEELTQIISEYISRNKALIEENIILKGRTTIREEQKTTKQKKKRSNKQ